MLRYTPKRVRAPRTPWQEKHPVIEIDIPDFGRLTIEHLVLDYNGTLACDGLLLEGVVERLDRLASRLTVHVVTADTFGKATQQLAQSPLTLRILQAGNQATAKARYVADLGSHCTACIGNGRNDRAMLENAALGICVMEREGAAGSALRAADVCARTAVEALDLLLHPKRLIAVLRS